MRKDAETHRNTGLDYVAHALVEKIRAKTWWWYNLAFEARDAVFTSL